MFSFSPALNESFMVVWVNPAVVQWSILVAHFGSVVIHSSSPLVYSIPLNKDSPNFCKENSLKVLFIIVTYTNFLQC